MNNHIKVVHTERVKKMLLSSSHLFFHFSLIYNFLIMIYLLLSILSNGANTERQVLFWTVFAALLCQIFLFPVWKNSMVYGRVTLVLNAVVFSVINIAFSQSIYLLLFLPMSVLCILNFDVLFSMILCMIGFINAIIQLARMLSSAQTTMDEYSSFIVIIFIYAMFAAAVGMVNKELGDNYQGVMGDLYRENRIHKKLYEKSTVDSTTELLNRNAYNEYLENFKDSAIESICCIYIDVNGLHEYNNTFGHQEGDRMLTTVASSIRTCFKSDKQYRVGGDEFVVICENAKFREVLCELKEFKSMMQTYKIHVATGMEWRDEDMDIEDMIKSADTKMYRDKEKFYEMYPEGRNSPVLYERAVE